MRVKELQSLKANHSNETTLLGMVTLVRLTHPLNNAEPMTDTPSGISMALRLLQPEKSVSALIPSGNVILASLVQSAKLPTTVVPSGTVISVIPVPLKWRFHTDSQVL